MPDDAAQASPVISARTAPSHCEVAAACAAVAALGVVLYWHLLPALLSGLLVYQLTYLLAARLPGGRGERAKLVAVALLAAVVVLLVAGAILGIHAFFRSEHGSLPALLGKMAEIIEGARSKLPGWLAEKLPADTGEIREALTRWLQGHAGEIQLLGKEAGHTIARLLIGMVIGALAALRQAAGPETVAPLAAALAERIRRFAEAFRCVVFAQVKISGMNTCFTALYLAVLLPLFGIHLPLVKTLVAITFIVGLIPVLGNLISNTAIVIISLSYSLEAAVASLLFLVTIHKLEYFLNARIIGAGIKARAWELLVAMLTLEAIFGISGVVAAPIYYAYLKGELADRGLV